MPLVDSRAFRSWCELTEPADPLASAQAPAISYEVFPLSLILSGSYEDLARRVLDRLSVFACERSPHIQDFARSEVHRWEKHGHSRTYVLITSDAGEIDVPAFFTVGMASLDFTRASRSTQKRLMGDVSLDQTGAFSIAELARSDHYSGDQLPGGVILDEAKEVIKRARSYVGGRFLVVDSRPEIFERLYKPAGFRQLHIAVAPRGMEETDFVTSCCVVKDWVDTH